MIAKNNYKTFDEFFKDATEDRMRNQTFEPYPYQKRLAEQEEIPEIISIPTGAGKTEAVVLGIYLWGILTKKPNMPKRLVYCLPMRVLVEQTIQRIESWIKKLGWDGEFKVVTLMGGDVDKDYKMDINKNMIIVGTQDMLLSRALNRGYTISPYQWPIEFGLLNNDCLWVMDEIQLMRNGLATSVQLESFRKEMKTYGPHKTVWMSATIDRQWLNTIDFDSSGCSQFMLEEKDQNNKELLKRNKAHKKLEISSITKEDDVYTKEDAQVIKGKHIKDSITLVIVNTVKRAQSLFKEINEIKEDCDVVLIHSRFRKRERDELNKKLSQLARSDNSNTIIISTQVIEAGVDISAKTMITELAPWPSMVQRFGRCNRRGEYEDSTIYVVGLDEKQYSPYETEDMKMAEKRVKEMKNKQVSPGSIEPMKNKIIHEAVIRRPDMIGLFDTSPDTSGNYTDVSKYVRSIERSLDVFVIWRELDQDGKPTRNKSHSDEACNVPISDIKQFIRKHKVWKYDHLDGDWEKAYDAYPGQTLAIHSKDGGYSNEVGWDINSKNNVDIIHKDPDPGRDISEEGYGEDSESDTNGWITLNDHTVHVINKLDDILKNTSCLDDVKDTLQVVAKYHDVGKAHQVFQNTMRKDTDEKISDVEFWAKRAGRAHHERENFRHEALSALAFLKINPERRDSSLAAYLIAAHHGRVRLSMRSMPRSKKRRKKLAGTTQYLLGMSMDSDEKVPIFFHRDKGKKSASKEKQIVDEQVEKEVTTNTNIARIGSVDGRPSWLQMTLKLLDEYGPFRLAFLEAIIRIADSSASAEESIKNART